MLTPTKETSRTLLVIGDLMRVLVNRADSNGHYIVVEAETSPKGGMPILHTHPAGETFYVQSGQFEIYRRDEAGRKYGVPLGAGQSAHIPGGEPHGFANVGATPGTLLMILDGVGRMDDFFAEIGIPVEDEGNLPVIEGPPDMEALMSVCARYDIAFVEGPPQ